MYSSTELTKGIKATPTPAEATPTPAEATPTPVEATPSDNGMLEELQIVRSERDHAVHEGKSLKQEKQANTRTTLNTAKAWFTI